MEITRCVPINARMAACRGHYQIITLFTQDTLETHVTSD